MYSLFLAAGSANQSIRQVVEDGFRVQGAAATLDDLVRALEGGGGVPDVILLSRYLPGGRDLQDVLPQLRALAPESRIVLLLGSMDAEALDLLRAAGNLGIYNAVVGNELSQSELLAALTEERDWRDIAPMLFPEIDGLRRPKETVVPEVGSEPAESSGAPAHSIREKRSPSAGVRKTGELSVARSLSVPDGLPREGLIGFMGALPRSGTTTLMAAWGLSVRSGPERIALLDAADRAALSAVLRGRLAEHGWEQARFAGQLVPPHHKEGRVYAWFRGWSPEWDQVNPDDLAWVLREIRAVGYSTMGIDLGCVPPVSGGKPHGHLLWAAENCEHLVMAVPADLAGLDALARLVAALPGPEARVHVVLTGPDGLDSEDVAAVLADLGGGIEICAVHRLAWLSSDAGERQGVLPA